MTGVHPTAATGFGAEAQAYHRARPSYPGAAVDWLARRAGIGPGALVADLAAGTGKLTALLAGRGPRLVAIEPVPGMRRQLRLLLPTVPVVAGVAQALPLADGSVDAVTVAQAFHWFDPEAAMTELARVIRPGGHLALLWNARDRGVDWVDRIWAVMDRVERDAPWHGSPEGMPNPSGHGRPPDLSRGEADLLVRGPWTPWQRAGFDHVHEVTPEQVIDRVRSVSHVAVLDAGQRRAVLDEIRTILGEHPDTRAARTVGIPYHVEAMVTRRLG